MAISTDKKRVYLTLTISSDQILEELAWQLRLTKSEYIEKLILENQEKKVKNEGSK